MEATIHTPDQSHEHASIRPYLLVFVALLVLTGTTVLASFIPVHDPWHTLIALAIASVKGSLVLWIFMHVAQASKLTRLFVFAGLFWISILIALTFSDYLTRQWMR